MIKSILLNIIREMHRKRIHLAACIPMYIDILKVTDRVEFTKMVGINKVHTTIKSI